MSLTSSPTRETHLKYLRQALSLARKSPPKPTNFRVGCVIVAFGPGDDPTDGTLLETGYTLELEGNTHAEQCALAKLAQREQQQRTAGGGGGGGEIMTPERNVHLYTTLEPCGKRLSGNTSCVERIIATRASGGGQGGGVRKVIFGAREPGTFVQDSQSLKMLDAAGVPWEYVSDGDKESPLEEEILRVAMEGHRHPQSSSTATTKAAETETEESKDRERERERGTNIDDISPEERRRQEAQPRNPKKRMMEVDLSR